MLSDGQEFPRADNSATFSTAGRVGHAQAGNAEARRRLVHLYTPLVYYWCRRADVPQGDAADIVQELFQAVEHDIHTIHGGATPATFRAWLRTIAHHKIADHFRVRRRQPEAAGGTTAQRRFQEIADSRAGTEMGELRDDCPESPDEMRLLRGRMLEIVQAEFEERTWRAFWRTAIDEQRPAAVAEELGMTCPMAGHSASTFGSSTEDGGARQWGSNRLSGSASAHPIGSQGA